MPTSTTSPRRSTVRVTASLNGTSVTRVAEGSAVCAFARTAAATAVSAVPRISARRSRFGSRFSMTIPLGLFLAAIAFRRARLRLIDGEVGHSVPRVVNADEQKQQRGGADGEQRIADVEGQP